MAYPIFDSHAHYDDERFDPDRIELLERLLSGEVGYIINCASDLETAQRGLELAQQFDNIYFAAGVHPHEADSWNDNSEAALRAFLAHPKCVAIGEIGLDYHYDFSPRETQQQVLIRQLELARELNMPVILHDREAHGDMYDILATHRPPRGVMHCFSGGVELARQSIALGLHIGLGGACTFKNARHPLEVAQSIPIERMLLETDCPYMAPVPHRGERCDSSMIALVAQKLAPLRELSPDELVEICSNNAKKLFSIE